MNVPALEKLAEILENLKRELPVINHGVDHFDLQKWKCGTAACAIGCAGLHPWFIERGFTLRPTGPRGTGGDMIPHCIMPNHFRKKQKEAYLGWPAVCMYFGLGQGSNEASYLFSSWHYEYGPRTKPSTVAKRIRKFTASGGKIEPHKMHPQGGI